MITSNPSQRRSHRQKSRNVRRPNVERLEDRLLLATLTVNSNGDTYMPDGEFTLREAIDIAAGTFGACLTDAEKGQIDGASFVPALAGPLCDFNPFTEARWMIDGGTAAANRDTIVFDSNVSTILPISELPVVECFDAIDGLAGRSSKVRLNGGMVDVSNGDVSNGLVLECEPFSTDVQPGNRIVNLEITRFQGDGIASSNGESVFQGLELFSNGGSGLYIDRGRGSQIGGPGAEQRNVIYDNELDGIRLEGSSDNIIENNFIGLKPDGDNALGNRGHGISVGGVGGAGGTQGNNVIGGNDPGVSNVISGNARFGVSLFNGFTGVNIVANNTIGLNASQRPNVATEPAVSTLRSAVLATKWSRTS